MMRARPREETIGGLRCHVAGGTDGRGGGDGPVVVLMHGFGAPGGDLIPLAGALGAPAGTRFVFPEAPLELPWGFDSRAWWMIDLERLERALRSGQARELGDEVPEGLPAAREKVMDLLAELPSRLDADPSRLVLGGFSQGSMLALDVALRMEAAPAGVILWSTTLLCASEWQGLMPGRAGLAAFQSHGRQDPLLPFAVAERLHGMLAQAGWQARFAGFSGAHEIPPVAVEGATRLLLDAFGDD